MVNDKRLVKTCLKEYTWCFCFCLMIKLQGNLLVNKTDLQALYLYGTYCNKTGTRPPSCNMPQELEVCVPELISNGTRQDETGRQFPNWRDRDKTTSLWSRCSEKFGKKSGKIRDGMGLLSTTREKSWMVLKWCSRMLGTGNFPDFSRKNQVPGKWHSGTQTSIKNWLYIQTKSQTINIERIDNVFSPFYFASP